MDVDGKVQAFLQHCVEMRFSHHTLRSYKKTLHDFDAYGDVENPANVTKTHVAEYVKALAGANYAVGTIKARVACLSSFYEWSISTGFAASNPTKHVKTPRAGVRVPKYVPRMEAMDAIDKISGDDLISLRNRAICELGYACAFRVSDLENADWRDLDLKEKKIKVTGKGDKEAWVIFGDLAYDALVIYIRARVNEKLGLKERALFLNAHGKRLRTIGRIVRHLLHYPPHTIFRHSSLTHWLMAGADIRQIQEHARHRSISTTGKYLEIDRKHLRDTYFASYPRARRWPAEQRKEA